MTAENRSLAWAEALVEELVRGGVREACVASGSRSSPLVLALAERAAAGRLRLVPQLDERSAAFFALGAAKATGRPAAVVTTSGTAAANLLPAAVEAARSETPLLLLTADRPSRLRGVDANQTIDQVRLFGPFARLFLDLGPPEVGDEALRRQRAAAARALAAALGPPAGPVQLNVQLDKPLERTSVPGDVPAGFAQTAPLAAAGRPAGAPFTRLRGGELTADADTLAWLESLGRKARRPLLVCGPSPAPWRDGPAALRLAAASGWPLLADALSGARFGAGASRRAVDAYDLVLRAAEAAEALAPDLVLRLGGTPTSAVLQERLAEWAAEEVVVDGGGAWPDAAATAAHRVAARPGVLCAALAERWERRPAEDGGRARQPGWGAAWRRAGAAARAALDEALREAPFEGTVLADAARLAPPDATLFVGSSMPVRDLDGFAAPREAPLRVVGLRGASGIDGSVSAALGAASARAPAPGLAVIGDVALYHDMNGLLAARRVEASLTIVVIHNDGGGIFHFLPIREERDVFEPYVAMPHGLDFAKAAALYELPFHRGSGPGGLEEALAAGGGPGVRLVEVPSDREENRRRHERAVRAAVRATEAALAAAARG